MGQQSEKEMSEIFEDAPAIAYCVMPFEDRRGIRYIEVRRTSLPDKPEAWAIQNESNGNLSRDGEWEIPSLPSSRTEDFYERCRWPSAQEAIEFAREHMKNYPYGYKDF
jgi:hypothetical protein